jgi:hypothetical protein
MPTIKPLCSNDSHYFLNKFQLQMHDVHHSMPWWPTANSACNFKSGRSFCRTLYYICSWGAYNEHTIGGGGGQSCLDMYSHVSAPKLLDESIPNSSNNGILYLGLLGFLTSPSVYYSKQNAMFQQLYLYLSSFETAGESVTRNLQKFVTCILMVLKIMVYKTQCLFLMADRLYTRKLVSHLNSKL